MPDEERIVNDDTLNETDKHFLREAGLANMAELDVAQLAMTDANHDSVQMFAVMMNRDHLQAYDELQTLALNFGITVSQEPDENHKQIKQQLMGQSGPAFDSNYMEKQITDHENTISLFETEVNGGQNQQVMFYANKYLPGLRLRLAKAQNMEM